MSFFYGSGKNVVLIGVAVTANVNEFTAMKAACNTSGACNVLRDIDRNFTVHYFVHGGKSRNFASQVLMNSAVCYHLVIDKPNLL